MKYALLNLAATGGKIFSHILLVIIEDNTIPACCSN